MAKLILSMDGLVLKEIPLDKERMSIGRKPHNDIQIDNLAISGEHAAVVTILNDSFLEDMNSTNGTLVNGQPIKKHFLKNGDVIELGKYKLKYLAEAGAADAADFERSMFTRPAAARRPPSAADSTAAQPLPPLNPGLASPAGAAARQPPAATLLAAVKLLNGANVGRELELTKALTTLGRPGVQVAVISRRPHAYFIAHAEGTQFPLVNGRAIGGQEHPLRDHDVLEIAGIRMEFFLKA
ncbi:FHA domain-containing protein [Rhodocyclus tenuis]|uniref:Putative component of type VI protein secretion system n=1 Tax=Rhodocyclus tenuis TaxID=1066 RepID=A0A840G4K6_RHOTE|nr:FHA domain-containing protein [Rhodocyclus tenuis]MBB4246866.1 putative component of type VI protein secretion system [Rhodocyclus tenuis]